MQYFFEKIMLQKDICRSDMLKIGTYHIGSYGKISDNPAPTIILRYLSPREPKIDKQTEAQ